MSEQIRKALPAKFDFYVDHVPLGAPVPHAVMRVTDTGRVSFELWAESVGDVRDAWPAVKPVARDQWRLVNRRERSARFGATEFYGFTADLLRPR